MIVIDEDAFDDVVADECETQQPRLVSDRPECTNSDDVIEQRVLVNLATNRVVQLRAAAVAPQSLERVVPQSSKFVRCGTSAKDVHVNCYVNVGAVADSHTVTTEHVRSVRELTRLLQQATRRTAKFVILLRQNGLGRIDQCVHFTGYLFVIFGRRGSPDCLGKYLVKRKFDGGGVDHVVVFDDDHFGHHVLIFDLFDVVNIDDVHHFDIFDVLDVFYIHILNILEIFLANRLFVEAVGDLFLVEYFV